MSLQLHPNAPASAKLSLESVSIDTEELTLQVGESKVITASLISDEVEDKTVTFASDNAEVATITPKQGTVKAIAVGTAIITATATNGMTAQCVVTVTA